MLATIAADQDAIIRDAPEGTVVVDGGPGTGKTVVALHRAAWLMHADQRIASHRGGVLFIGPHHRYLAYVADVLPNLGEVGVQIATLADLVPQGATAIAEPDPRVRALKLSAELTAAVDPAVALYEEPPTDSLLIDTEAGELEISAQDWADAFATADPGVGHNEARDQIWEELLDLLIDRLDEDDLAAAELEPDQVRAELAADDTLRSTFSRAWPILDPADLVADLWAVPAYLRRCAPQLTPDQRALLRRPEGSAWTDADLPLLDAMGHRLGDAELARRRRRQQRAVAENRAYMDQVVDRLLEADTDPESPLNLLRRESIRDDLVDQAAVPAPDRDRLAGPFAQVIVDEAQELLPGHWQQLVRRCPSRSFTVVGDRAQAREGIGLDWDARLAQVGLAAPRVRTLSLNYRTPAEVMDLAEPVIRAVVPDANVPRSVRHSGHPVLTGNATKLQAAIRAWLDDHPTGVAAILAADPQLLAQAQARFAGVARVSVLTPELAKGLEFDCVALLDPAPNQGPSSAVVDRYVAMTRTTDRLFLVD